MASFPQQSDLLGARDPPVGYQWSGPHSKHMENIWHEKERGAQERETIEGLPARTGLTREGLPSYNPFFLVPGYIL